MEIMINTLQEAYQPLIDVLQSALEQAAFGKGKERHAGEKPFIRQPIMEIGRMVGMGYQTGQAMKKIQEAHTLLNLEGKGPDAAILELLGAINYCAAAIIAIQEEKEKHAD